MIDVSSIIKNWARDNIDNAFHLFGFAEDVDDDDEDDLELGEEDAKVIVLPSIVGFVVMI
jgi:hypothetical protein